MMDIFKRIAVGYIMLAVGFGIAYLAVSFPPFGQWLLWFALVIIFTALAGLLGSVFFTGDKGDYSDHY